MPDPYLCVTAPCGPYTPSPAVQSLLTRPSAPLPRSNYGRIASPNYRDPFAYVNDPVAGPLSAFDIWQIQNQFRNVISPAEHREIDAAAAEQASRAERIEHLGEYVDTIHPDRLLEIADNIAAGRRQGPPASLPMPGLPVREEPYTEARTEEGATNVYPLPQGVPNFTRRSLDTPARIEPDLLPPEPEDEPMADLSGLFGNIASGVAGNFFDTSPGWDYGFDDLAGDVIDYFNDPVGPQPGQQPRQPTTSLPSTGGTRMGPYNGGCISERDRRISQLSGVSAESVDRVLHYARQGRKRRKRMLTKSDIGDISTMKSILGGGEAFKMWLARATR